MGSARRQKGEPMSDLISRQAAIDAVGSMLRRKFGIGGDLAEITLARLPSAQPEIIRCKDCKYWMRAYLSISGKHGCNVMRDYTAPDDYCFKAERKA